jgi:hypothetical protein
MTSLTRLFQAVSKQSETDKLLTALAKLPAVSRFHGFQGVPPRDFKLAPAASILKLAKAFPKKQ